MEIAMKRKNVDLPVDVLARLTAMAAANGRTLKKYLETIIIDKVKESPSPSDDPWFDVPENIRMVQRGIRQLDNGEGRTYTAEELKTRLGI